MMINLVVSPIKFWPPHAKLMRIEWPRFPVINGFYSKDVTFEIRGTEELISVSGSHMDVLDLETGDAQVGDLRFEVIACDWRLDMYLCRWRG